MSNKNQIPAETNEDDDNDFSRALREETERLESNPIIQRIFGIIKDSPLFDIEVVFKDRPEILEKFREAEKRRNQQKEQE